MRGYHRLNFPVVLLLALFMLAAVWALWTREQKVRQSEEASRRSRAELIRSGRDQRLHKFSLVGFNDAGKKFWKLEGDTAKIDPGQTIFLDQNVVLRLKDDTVIHTDKVRWSPDNATMTTDAPVRVDHEKTVITGRGATGRPNDGFVQLNHDVEMRIHETATVTCLGPMKIFYNQDKMIFLRKVKVKDQRGTLTATRMDVFFDSRKREVNRIVAIGNVVIERGSDTTHSHRAIYLPANGSIRLEGNPEITLHKGSTALLDGSFRN